ncbi:type II toxin-antitoxin system YafQ family toxin [Helicobacter sp. MIT 11-5569]|uniref:type II toxin-antitoxin system YafQ family toxin n=1 Tax=Helicobacter sp. MIT 11-5569 TaxID=1548151 RepID=UPI00051FBCE6|nr:type II toxin-antitoxin system YafQ family toxin [Helicobacter sp. MIT 11-5569]TLD84998.1 type II toxin-antitoxin system YafQ family toxin [Helicobacter sp. MIT 11-5569]
MKYSIVFTKTFKKAFKKLTRSDKEQTLEILNKLANKEALKDKYHDHALMGEFKGCRDCHIRPDLVLVYKINDEFLEVLAMRISNHSKLF